MNNALYSPGLGNLWQFLRAWTNPKTDDMPGLGYLICFQTIFECEYLRGKICSISLVHGFGCFCSALLSILWADSILEQALHHIYIYHYIYTILYILYYTQSHIFSNFSVWWAGKQYHQWLKLGSRLANVHKYHNLILLKKYGHKIRKTAKTLFVNFGCIALNRGRLKILINALTCWVYWGWMMKFDRPVSSLMSF